jgi:hypothetical protein
VFVSVLATDQSDLEGSLPLVVKLGFISLSLGIVSWEAPSINDDDMK